MFNEKSRFRNFKNLYDMNRGDSANTDFANKLESDESAVNKSLAASRANSEHGASAIDKAKELAKSVSDRADSWNPDSQARARGLSGTAAGVTSFYSGNQDPRMARFKNLYSTVAGVQAPMKPGEFKKQEVQEPTQLRTDSQDRAQAEAIGRRKGSEITGVAPLDYLLKTGKIDLQTYYNAQKDPNLYAKVLQSGGYK